MLFQCRMLMVQIPKIVLVLDQDSEDYLSITENGLKLAGIQALAEKLDELDWAEPDA